MHSLSVCSVYHESRCMACSLCLFVGQLLLVTWLQCVMQQPVDIRLHIACMRILTAMQGQWLVFGGFPVPAEDEMTKMFAFDLSTLSWSLLDLTGTPLQHRMSYHAACHNDSLVVVGGILPCLSLLLHFHSVMDPCNCFFCLAVTPAW